MSEIRFHEWYLEAQRENQIDSILLQDKHIKARKYHECSSCKRGIPKGMKYRRQFAIVDGEPCVVKTCFTCEMDEHAI